MIRGHFIPSFGGHFISALTIGAKHDRDIFPVVPADLAHNVLDHLCDRIGVVGVLVAGAEHGIDHKPAPIHLKRGKPLDLLVRGLHPVPSGSIVIVENHHIDSEDDRLRFLQVQPPQEELLQKTPKEIDPRPPKGAEETLDGMRGERLFRFDGPDVTVIFPKPVERRNWGQTFTVDR